MTGVLLLGVLLGLSIRPSLADLPYTLLWKYPAGRGASVRLAAADSMVFLGDEQGRTAALRLRDGFPVWQNPGSVPVCSSSALSGSTLVWADRFGRVRAVDSLTGAQLWSISLAERRGAELRSHGAVLLANGRDGRLYALNPETGNELWRVRVDPGKPSAVVHGADGMVIAGGAGRLLRIDPADGQRRACRAAGDYRILNLAIRARQVLAGCADGYVRAFAEKDLSPRWATRLGSPCEFLALAPGGTIMAATRSGWLYALEASSGATLWHHQLKAGPAGMVAATAKPGVIVGTEDGQLIAVAESGGTVRWQVRLSQAGPARPLAATGSLLLALAGDGNLFLFQRLAACSVSEADEDEWWSLYESGQRVGYLHRATTADLYNGGRALRCTDASVEWSGTMVRRSTTAWVDGEMRPLAFCRQRIDGPQIVATHGVWRGDTLLVERRLGGAVRRDTAVTGTGFVMPQWFGRHVCGGDSTLYGRDSVRVFDYDLLRPVWREYVVSAAQDTTGGARVRVHQKGRDRAGTVIQMVRWLDGRGRMVLRQTPLLGTAAWRTDSARALAWAPAQALRHPVLDRSIRRAALADQIELELPSLPVAPEAILLSSERQGVEPAQAAQYRLKLEPSVDDSAHDARAHSDGAGASGVSEYLQTSLYVQSDDPQIRRIAKEMSRDAGDRLEIARRVHHWVYDHMVPRVTPAGFRSAAEVVADLEGTCSEYTVLLMAVARAAGLPSRACSGLLIHDSGDLVPHLWAQVYVGRWLDLDATQPEPGLSAAHLHTGSGRLTPGGLRSMNLPLQLFLAQVDTFKVIGYRHGTRKFVAAAASLHQEAVEARRSGQDERAQELYHRLTLQDWNAHSGRAYMAIARYRLQQEEHGAARWACEQILRHEPAGPEADDALYYLARIAEEENKIAQAMAHLRRVVRQLPDHDLADDALARLATLLERTQGCAAAVPVYQRLRRQYGESGWAAVARSALERCAGK